MAFSLNTNKYAIVVIILISIVATVGTVLYLEYDVEYLRLPLKYFYMGLMICLVFMFSYLRFQSVMIRSKSKKLKGLLDFDGGPFENDNSNLDEFIAAQRNKKKVNLETHSDD